jgi:hypothetical protein
MRGMRILQTLTALTIAATGLAPASSRSTASC